MALVSGYAALALVLGFLWWPTPSHSSAATAHQRIGHAYKATHQPQHRACAHGSARGPTGGRATFDFHARPPVANPNERETHEAIH
jgi:hypothetical protein